MADNRAQHIFWTRVVHEDWNLLIAAVEEGLCYIDTQGDRLEQLNLWASTRYPGSLVIQDEEKLRPYADELLEYAQGARTQFSMPVVFHGTPFQQSVWNALRDIPCGEIRTYADIAGQLGKPKAVRAVGAAIGANPLMIVVPCHRVIGKDRSLTGFRGGLPTKAKLLRLEGIGVTEQGYVRYA